MKLDKEEKLNEFICLFKTIKNKFDFKSLRNEENWIELLSNKSTSKRFIFRKNNGLIISTDGTVEKGKWEIIGDKSIMIEINEKTQLFETILFDGIVFLMETNQKVICLINENKSNFQIHNIEDLILYFEKYYSEKSSEDYQRPPEISKKYEENDRQTKKVLPIVFLIWFLVIFIILIIFFRLINS